MELRDSVKNRLLVKCQAVREIRLTELFNAGHTYRDYKRFMKMLTGHKINPQFKKTIFA